MELPTGVFSILGTDVSMMSLRHQQEILVAQYSNIYMTSLFGAWQRIRMVSVQIIKLYHNKCIKYIILYQSSNDVLLLNILMYFRNGHVIKHVGEIVY